VSRARERVLDVVFVGVAVGFAIMMAAIVVAMWRHL
jgi:hypothetical protein